MSRRKIVHMVNILKCTYNEVSQVKVAFVSSILLESFKPQISGESIKPVMKECKNVTIVNRGTIYIHLEQI